MAKNVKKRNWAFVIYPDSLPDGWLDILIQTGLPIAISPLHDKDLDPTGSPKKPHYHVICCYSGPTSYNVVKSLTDSLHAPIPQPLEQVRGYFRYLTHKDNPEKAQYLDSDIRYLNGFNILDYAELTKSEVDSIRVSLCELIRHEDIKEYCDFINFLLDNSMTAEFSIASTSTIFFDRYISSRRHAGDVLHAESIIHNEEV